MRMAIFRRFFVGRTGALAGTNLAALDPFPKTQYQHSRLSPPSGLV